MLRLVPSLTKQSQHEERPIIDGGFASLDL